MAVDSLVGRIAGVSYLHIPARDAAASAGFYRDVFGWPLHGRPDEPSFSDGTGHVIGRWVTDQAAVGADGLRAYIYVADVDDTLDAVTTHGGQVVKPPYPEGTLRVALFADPAGNVLGIWQETSDSPGSWVDRPSEAITFYQAAFGATVVHQAGEGEDIVAQQAVGDALLCSQRSPLSPAHHCQARAWAIRFRAATSAGFPPKSSSWAEYVAGGIGVPSIPGSGRSASGRRVWDGIAVFSFAGGTATAVLAGGSGPSRWDGAWP